MSKTAILREDNISVFHRGHVYGKKGEKVTIIAEHGNGIIVEKANGKRFPVKTDYLTKSK